MRITVDGVIYQKLSRRGIPRVYDEILPRMCEIDDTLRIQIITQGSILQGVPTHQHIEHVRLPDLQRYLRPNRIWAPIIPGINSLVRRYWATPDRDSIWHSTYYTLPDRWKGPIVTQVYDMIVELYPEIYSATSNKAYCDEKRRCVIASDVVIAISENTARDIQAYYGIPRSAIQVVPLGFSDVFTKLPECPDEHLPVNVPFLLYVGGRGPHKNFGRVLHAYSLCKYQKDVALVVVGGSLTADESGMIRDLQITGNVIVLPDVDDAFLCVLYNRASGMIYPSIYEGFGIPLLEAMACGCPVVASRIPSTVEVAGTCPIYFDPYDIENMIEAFDQVLSEGKKSERVQSGFAQAGIFSWDLTAEKTLAVYRTLN